MPPAPAQTYAHAIPSLSQTNPTLPALGNLDVNRAIVANTPIDPADLPNAKVVLKKLKATLESPVNPGVTEDMVQSAELRLKAIEGAYIAATYAPGLSTGIAAILQRLDTLDANMQRIDANMQRLDDNMQRLDDNMHRLEEDNQITNAMAQNHRIIARNLLNQPNCEPLRKTVPGHDLNRVVAVTRPSDRRSLVPPPQPIPIGSVPPHFIPNIVNYTTKDIAKLMLFYNEDFGILEDDNEGDRRTKLLMFLSRY